VCVLRGARAVYESRRTLGFALYIVYAAQENGCDITIAVMYGIVAVVALVRRSLSAQVIPKPHTESLVFECGVLMIRAVYITSRMRSSA
jgi:hypothetical protein